MDSIVLRDRNGKEINYHGIDYLNVKTPDGETQGYAAYDPETLVPENLVSGVVVGDVEGALKVPQAVETTIDPDFSAGDMEVVPEDGQVFSKVGILKPANLLPENIAEDVDVAGIIGALEASGGAASCTFKIEDTSGAAGPKTIYHNLGAVPDLFFIWNYSSSLVATKGEIQMAIGFSSSFQKKLGYDYSQWYVKVGGGLSNWRNQIESSQGSAPISAATENSIVVGQSSNNRWLNTAGLYSWIAVSIK